MGHVHGPPADELVRLVAEQLTHRGRDVEPHAVERAADDRFGGCLGEHPVEFQLPRKTVPVDELGHELAGHVAEKTEGASLTEQTTEVLALLEETLEAAGSGKERILSVQIFLTDIGKIGEMNAVWDSWVAPGHAPARATVEARLASPGYGIEITAGSVERDHRPAVGPWGPLLDLSQLSEKMRGAGNIEACLPARVLVPHRDDAAVERDNQGHAGCSSRPLNLDLGWNAPSGSRGEPHRVRLGRPALPVSRHGRSSLR